MNMQQAMKGALREKRQAVQNIPGRGRQQVRCSKCNKLLGIVTPSDGGAQIEIKCTRCKKNNVVWA